MELSVLIPARNEMFLARTIEDVIAHSEADTEVIAVLDGAWAEPVIQDHPRVNLVYHPVAVGQRAATNEAARLSKAKYVMKLDAHCSVGQGFDRIMLEDMQPGWTMVPAMHNLHAFDWLCQDCGHRQYQGPTPETCPECGGTNIVRDMLWQAKPSPVSTAMRFDRNLKFQYWSAYKKQQVGDLVDTMSILGACWLVERERYFELDLCDERHGGWGQQGTEVACKTWLSGGRLVVNKRTWFAHLFRTQGGDFGFPYAISGKAVSQARRYSQELWRADAPDEMPRWDKAMHPLSWLIDKFAPVPDWEERIEDDQGDKQSASTAEVGQRLQSLSQDNLLGKGPSMERLDHKAVHARSAVQKMPSLRLDTESTLGLDRRSARGQLSCGIVYYTDNRLDPTIMKACQRQLEKAGLPIVSVSLQPLDFGQNIVIEAERGPLTLFRQILAGLEAIGTDVVFFAEHDVVYHPSHFQFTPERNDLFYYNNNLWKVDARTGKALFHYSNHTSQLCARRDLLLEHYVKRVAMVQQHGFSRRMGFEPGTHGRKERVDDYKHETWMSECPNLDLRHGKNMTQTRWQRSQFRNQRFTKGWTVAEEVPCWGQTRGRMKELLYELSKHSDH